MDSQAAWTHYYGHISGVKYTIQSLDMEFSKVEKTAHKVSCCVHNWEFPSLDVHRVDNLAALGRPNVHYIRDNVTWTHIDNVQKHDNDPYHKVSCPGPLQTPTKTQHHHKQTIKTSLCTNPTSSYRLEV